MPPKTLPPTLSLAPSRSQVELSQLEVLGAQLQRSTDQQDEHEQIVPEPTRESHPLRAQVIDIRDFVAAKLRVHDGTVLDEVKQRMWTRWLKGLDMLPMRSNFQDPVTGLVPSRKSVEIVDIWSRAARRRRFEQYRRRLDY